MRLGERLLCLSLAIAIKDRATEQEDEHCDGEDEHTKSPSDADGQPPQRERPAIFEGSFAHFVHWKLILPVSAVFAEFLPAKSYPKSSFCPMGCNPNRGMPGRTSS
jgi:hypothetical protein